MGQLARLAEHTELPDSRRPGRHTLVVETDGFGRYEARINVPDGRLTPVAVSMQGSLGVLVVRSDPKGAMVVVDGKEIGLTPVTIQPIAPGSHGELGLGVPKCSVDLGNLNE